MMRSHRRAPLAWSQSGRPWRDARPRLTRARRVRRFLRTATLLTVLGLTPVARAAAGRWRVLLPGMVLTVAGVVLHDGLASIVLLPGLVLLFSAPLVPARFGAERTRRSELAREVAVYSTPAQLRELETILDRYPDDVTLELRDILARQRLAARDGRFPARGR
jgi:hypothetical protein